MAKSRSTKTKTKRPLLKKITNIATKVFLY
ncbi:MAG: monofunctional biosynthetic peptidoglycan transglycosylase, partial [Pedobacter sp.]